MISQHESAYSVPMPVYSLKASFTPAFAVGTLGFSFVEPTGGMLRFGASRLREKLESLRSLPENWDGFDSAAPNGEAIDNAAVLMQELYDAAVDTELPWIRPHISASEDGSVLLEWWSATKKLSLYVASEECTYIKVWGLNVETEMDDGQVQDFSADLEALWRWLSD
jgi:hypothetical protein